MFSKILWATDGSAAADHALPWVKGLATERDATVVVCHSVVAMIGPRAGGVPLDADEDDVEVKLRVQMNDLAAAGVDAKLRLVGGDTYHGAAHDIVRVADEEGVDLIVAGTRGHTAIGGLLLGSVTQRLLQLAPCPVLVIPTRAANAAAMEDTEAEQTVA
jgi:nucleotide-binding universal stress UspA family protein